jgi:hypothetical protein
VAREHAAARPRLTIGRQRVVFRLVNRKRPGMANLVDLLVPPFWIGAICTVGYTAIDSPLRPVQSWVSGWRDGFSYAKRHYWVALFILLVFFASPALDFLFGRYLRVPGWMLMTAAFSWQAIGAGILAFFAYRIHQFAVQVCHPGDQLPYTPNRKRELWAFALGVGIFLTLLGVNFGLGYLASMAPRSWSGLANAANGWTRTLLFVPLSLIRPCLSLGARKPVRSGFVGFSRRPIAFLIWISALGIPSIFAHFAMDSFVKPGNMAMQPYWTSRSLMALFDLFNFMAFEMATLRMVRNLSWKPEEDFEVGQDERF